MDKADFFISRAGADAAWAKWIAYVLEVAGYTTFLQDADFLPGESFVELMDRGAQCRRTLAVASPDYIKSAFTVPEWQAAFAKDPTGKDRKLIVVRIRECDLPPLLAPRIYIDLVGKNEQGAREALLRGVPMERITPALLPPSDTRALVAAFPAGKGARFHSPGFLVLDNITAEFSAAEAQLSDEGRKNLSLLLARLAELRGREDLFGRDPGRQSTIWEIVHTMNEMVLRELGKSVLNDVSP